MSAEAGEFTMGERVVLAGLGVAEFEAWAGLLGLAGPVPATPFERLVALPSWARPELVETASARARLQEWTAAGSPPITPDDVVRRLQFAGDDELLHLVRRVLLEQVAPPAAHYVLANFLVLGVGASAAGWCARLAPVPGPVLRLVMLTPGVGLGARAIALHELAHAWLEADPEQPANPAELANGYAAILLDRARRGPEALAELLADGDQREARADALARRWGARIDGSGDRGTRYSERQAAGLLAAHGPGPS